MSTEGENKLNDFEDRWLQGEAEQKAPDAESAATVQAARAEESKALDEYVQAHAELESEQK